MRAVRARVVDYVRTIWTDLGDYRDADIDRFVSTVVPVVAGGQRQVAALTDAYLASVGTVILGKSVRPVGIPANVINYEALRGVPAAKVYARPGNVVWTALAGGVNLDEAVQRGLGRAMSITATDLQLARTHATRYAMANNDRIVGFRRVPSGGNVCELCSTASTQRYHRDDLLPIHPGCSCGVEPIYGTEDPGQVIDPGTSDTGEPNTVDNPSDVVVHDHGELGPVLAVKGQAFRGPDDLED